MSNPRIDRLKILGIANEKSSNILMLAKSPFFVTCGISATVGYIFINILDGGGTTIYNDEIVLRKVTQQFAKPFDVVPMGCNTI